MSTRKSHGSNPARSIQLLWGDQLTSSRSGITIKGIIDAAITVANQEGLAALSMRRVAARLNVGTMSLYTYVPGRAELLDLMADTAVADLYNSIDELALAPTWQDGLRLIAQKNWDLYEANPWLLEMHRGRPVLGPHTTLKYESELRALEGIGLDDIAMDAILTLVLTHVESCARTLLGMQRERQESGMKDTQWWLSHAPLLNSVMDPKKFPIATRVGQAAGETHQSHTDPKFIYSFGLERIIAGTEVLINQSLNTE